MTMRHRSDERGASLVEFALVAPILFMLLFGTITGGLALSHKLDLSTGGREAARFGATLPVTEYGSVDGADWAWHVAQEAISQAGGALNVSGATVCVALMTGPPNTPPYTPSGGSAYFYSASYPYPYPSSTGSTNGCYDDSGVDGQPRVQIAVTRPDSFQAVVFTKTLTLTAKVDARFEPGL